MTKVLYEILSKSYKLSDTLNHDYELWSAFIVALWNGMTWTRDFKLQYLNLTSKAEPGIALVKQDDKIILKTTQRNVYYKALFKLYLLLRLALRKGYEEKASSVELVYKNRNIKKQKSFAFTMPFVTDFIAINIEDIITSFCNTLGLNVKRNFSIYKDNCTFTIELTPIQLFESSWPCAPFINADTCIQVQGKEFRISKEVMIKFGGAYMKTLFTSEFKENRENRLSLDVDPDLFEMYLKCIMEGPLSLENRENVDIIGLFDLAMYLGHDSLGILCLEIIKSAITEEDIEEHIEAVLSLKEKYPKDCRLALLMDELSIYYPTKMEMIKLIDKL